MFQNWWGMGGIIMLPTKANLVARGMLGTDAQLCVFGCGEVETAQHLFVSCHIFRELWSHVRA